MESMSSLYLSASFHVHFERIKEQTNFKNRMMDTNLFIKLFVSILHDQIYVFVNEAQCSCNMPLGDSMWFPQ